VELWESILIHAISKQGIVVTIPDAPDMEKLFEMDCYQALRDIRTILEDDSLSDPECFMRIEETISLFEALGNDTGPRRDFRCRKGDCTWTS